MSGDLISLRMLMVALTQAEQRLWHGAATMAAVPIDLAAHDAAAAVDVLSGEPADICIMGGAVAEPDGTAVIRAARTQRPGPLVLISTSNGAGPYEGIDGTLKSPETIDDARRLTDLCIRARIPTRVLVVDDSGTMRSIVRKILTASRFALDVHEASEGFAALSQLRDTGYGIVFLDYNMPGFTGLETLSEIKRENQQVAVVMMTSTVDDAVAERVLAAGAFAFLKKPFYPADIDAVLQRYYGLHVPVA